MKKGRNAHKRRSIRAWAVIFWLAVWQAVSMALDQQILLVSPVRVLVRLAGLAAGARWGLAGFACLWMALCTAVGPLYWVEGSIADWSWANTAYFLISFAAYLGIVILLVRWARRRRRRSFRPRVKAAAAATSTAAAIR